MQGLPRNPIAKVGILIGLWAVIFASYAWGMHGAPLVACGVFATLDMGIQILVIESSTSLICPSCKRHIPKGSNCCARCTA